MRLYLLYNPLCLYVYQRSFSLVGLPVDPRVTFPGLRSVEMISCATYSYREFTVLGPDGPLGVSAVGGRN